MRRALLLTLLIPSCAAPPRAATPGMFAPQSIRLHPVFTQVKDWTGDGTPDGLAVALEILDGFGDATKSAGVVTFDVYTLETGSADPRGARLSGPYAAPLDTVAQQKQHWQPVPRVYEFRIEQPNTTTKQNYVLAAQLAPPGGPRLFDRLVLGPEPAR